VRKKKRILSGEEFIEEVRGYRMKLENECNYLDRIAKKNKSVFIKYLATEIFARSYSEYESLCDEIGEIDSDTREYLELDKGDPVIHFWVKTRMKQLVKTPFSLYWSEMELQVLRGLTSLTKLESINLDRLHKMYARNETQTMQEFVEGIENHIYEVKNQLEEERVDKTNPRLRGRLVLK